MRRQSKVWSLLRSLMRGEPRVQATASDLNKSNSKGRWTQLKQQHPWLKILVQVVGIVFFVGLFGMYGYLLGRALPGTQSIYLVMMHVLVLMTGVFAIFTNVTVLYYADNLPFYLCLPLTKQELVLAKLLQASLLALIQSGVIIVLPFAIGVGISQGAGLRYYLSVILGGSALAFTAQSVVALILVFVMRFTKFARNKDRFTMIFSTLFVILIVALSLLPQFLSQQNSSDDFDQTQRAMVASFSQGMDNPALRWIGLILAPPLFILRQPWAWASGEMTIPAVLLMIVIAGAIFALIVCVAQYHYLPGAMAVQGAGGGKKRGRLKASEQQAGLRQRSPFRALMKKDFVLLRRTPTFFTNYLLSSFLVPLIMVIAFAVPLIAQSSQLTGEKIQGVLAAIHEFWQNTAEYEDVLPWIFIGYIGILAFMHMSSSISLSMISREGQQAFLMKLMPQSYLTQLRAKISVGFLIGVVSTVIFLVPIILLKGAPWYVFVLMILIFLSEAYHSQVLDGLLDLTYARTDWSDEMEIAKRQGISFGAMGLSLLMAALKILPIYFFARYVSASLLHLSLITFGIYLIFHVLAEWALRSYGVSRMAKLQI